MSKVEQAIQIIRNHYPIVEAIYIFGSHGSAHETSKSDLDIAILVSQQITSLECWKLAQDIAYAIHCEVDLINLRDASTVLRYEIISTGNRVYCSNKESCDLFETYVYSAYVRFNDERREILNAIQQRGQILNG